MDDDGGMEALFSTFMNEVNNTKSNKMKKIENNFGTPEEIVERLTSSVYDPRQGHGSAYGMLGISPEASEAEITKHYRKVSLLIHPDRCHHEKAKEAFQVLAKAYADTKDPSYNDKYKDLVRPAKERVRKRREAENRLRAKKGEDPLDMEGNDFDQEVLRECEKVTSESSETATYTNAVQEANMKRLEEIRRESKLRRREEEAEKRKFERGRDKRAAGWQTFINNAGQKKFKSQHSFGDVGVADKHHHREQRNETVHGKAELDLTDNKIKYSDTQAGQTGVDREYRKKWR